MKVLGTFLSVASTVYAVGDIEQWEVCLHKGECKSSRDNCCPASPALNIDLNGATVKLCGSSSSKFDEAKVPASSATYGGWNWYKCNSVGGAQTLTVVAGTGISAILYSMA